MTVAPAKYTEMELLDALQSDLAALDIQLKVQDGRLGYDAPPGAFTDALRQRVRELRPALLTRLGGTAVVAPLSCGQERMWFLNRLEGRPGVRTGTYTEQLAFALTGPLDRRAMGSALSALTARHGALRTLFREGPDGPEQVVAAPAEGPAWQ